MYEKLKPDLVSVYDNSGFVKVRITCRLIAAYELNNSELESLKN